MKLVIYTFLIVLSQACEASAIQGVWKHEDDKVVATYVFNENNKCIFGFVAKGEIDGISPECTYSINKHRIIVVFENPKSNKDDEMHLEYDINHNIIKEIKVNDNYFGFIFRKRNGL